MPDYNYNNQFTNQVSWNAAGQFSQEIFNIIKSATDAFRRGNLNKWFIDMQAAKFYAAQSFSDEELLELLKMEVEIAKLIVPKKRVGFESSTNENSGELFILINKYHLKLMKILDSYNWIAHHKENSTIMRT